jgi:hypothetical protein
MKERVPLLGMSRPAPKERRRVLVLFDRLLNRPKPLAERQPPRPPSSVLAARTAAYSRRVPEEQPSVRRK